MHSPPRQAALGPKKLLLPFACTLRTDLSLSLSQLNTHTLALYFWIYSDWNHLLFDLDFR